MSDTDPHPDTQSPAADPTSGENDRLAPLRRQLADLSTESVDGAGKDLDLRSTEDLVLAMNKQDALVPGAVGAAAGAITQAVDAITERLSRGGRLIYLGAGTSGRLGVLDASECPPTFGVKPELVVGIIAGGDRALRSSIESAEDAFTQGRDAVSGIAITSGDALVGIAASGRTPYVLGAIRQAREIGALTVALACNKPSEIGRLADIAIEIEVGPEFIAGSTRLKSGTAEKLVLNMLSTLTMVRLGKTFGNVMIDLRASNDKLRARAQRTVMAVTGRDVNTATRALDAADGSAKLATLMLLADISPDQANKRLEQSNGHLRAALQNDFPSSHPSDTTGTQWPPLQSDTPIEF